MLKKYLKYAIAIIYARLIILDRDHTDIKMSYGSFFGISKSRYIHGGQVKTYNLRKKYLEHLWSFNCIYLVSSALPFYIPDACKILKKRGFKIILNQNGVGYPAWTSEYERINTELRKVYEVADLIFYQSHFAKVSCKFWLGDTNGLELLAYNPVDLHKFFPSKNKNNKIHILSASTFQQLSSVQFIFDVAASLISSGLNFQWEIAGHFSWTRGYDQVAFELHKRGLGDHVHLTGIYSRDEAPKIFQKSNIFVHINTSMDVCPTSIIEALSAGLPVVGLNSGGVPELVDPSSGVLVNINGENNYYEFSLPAVDSVVEAIYRISENIGDYSRNARSRAENYFDENKWLEKHQDAIEGLFGNKVT